MNSISSILRIVCGLGLLVLSYSVYRKHSEPISAGGAVEIFGVATGASPGHVTIAFAVIGLLGLGFVVLGLIGLLKARR